MLYALRTAPLNLIIVRLAYKLTETIEMRGLLSHMLNATTWLVAR